MDYPNAFIGKSATPTPAELSATLGPTATLWDQLVTSLTTDLGIPDEEWNSLKPKYG